MMVHPGLTARVRLLARLLARTLAMRPGWVIEFSCKLRQPKLMEADSADDHPQFS
jgi:hypothetical protein